MNLLPFKRSEKDISALTVDDLLIEAQTFGRPRLSMMDNGGWHASIEFPTVAGTSLQAKSEFNHATAAEALVVAIDRARTIRAAFK